MYQFFVLVHSAAALTPSMLVCTDSVPFFLDDDRYPPLQRLSAEVQESTMHNLTATLSQETPRFGGSGRPCATRIVFQKQFRRLCRMIRERGPAAAAALDQKLDDYRVDWSARCIQAWWLRVLFRRGYVRRLRQAEAGSNVLPFHGGSFVLTGRLNNRQYLEEEIRRLGGQVWKMNKSHFNSCSVYTMRLSYDLITVPHSLHFSHILPSKHFAYGYILVVSQVRKTFTLGATIVSTVEAYTSMSPVSFQQPHVGTFGHDLWTWYVCISVGTSCSRRDVVWRKIRQPAVHCHNS